MGSPVSSRGCVLPQSAIIMRLSILLVGLVQGLCDGVTLWRVEFAMWASSLGRNEGLFSEPYSKILRDEVILWVKCGGRFTLDHERRFSLVVSPRSFRMGSPF